jgi:hypothetical protein
LLAQPAHQKVNGLAQLMVRHISDVPRVSGPSRWRWLLALHAHLASPTLSPRT